MEVCLAPRLTRCHRSQVIVVLPDEIFALNAPSDLTTGATEVLQVRCKLLRGCFRGVRGSVGLAACVCGGVPV
jgi:hypothetical protein